MELEDITTPPPSQQGENTSEKPESELPKPVGDREEPRKTLRKFKNWLDRIIKK